MLQGNEDLGQTINKKTQHFDCNDLEEATNNFFEQKLLGCGSR